MIDSQSRIICPDCKKEIEKPEAINVGDILECSECGTEIEIISVDPLKYTELIEEK